MQTVADSIAAFLAEKGITHAFGIIGAGNAALFDAIHRAKKTEIVCCHHEAAAVMAAGGYARVRGSCVSVALVTTGAGSSNAVTGALAALMDSVPVLIISGNEPSKYIGSKNRVIGVQGFNTPIVAEHVSKEAWGALGAAVVVSALRQCLDNARSGRPGPVWLDIPRDYFNAMV